MIYDKKWFDHMEVKPENGVGWYSVTLYQFNKMEREHPDYIREWLYFDGEQWDYCGTYSGNTYVCFIHAREGE